MIRVKDLFSEMVEIRGKVNLDKKFVGTGTGFKLVVQVFLVLSTQAFTMFFGAQRVGDYG